MNYKSKTGPVQHAQVHQYDPNIAENGVRRRFLESIPPNKIPRGLLSSHDSPTILLNFQSTFSIFNKAKANWRLLFILFFLLLLIGIFYKFNNQLIQLNKQFVEFVQEQYEQQRHIFG